LEREFLPVGQPAPRHGSGASSSSSSSRLEGAAAAVEGGEKEAAQHLLLDGSDGAALKSLSCGMGLRISVVVCGIVGASRQARAAIEDATKEWAITSSWNKRPTQA
jgi:hypothetical protein